MDHRPGPTHPCTVVCRKDDVVEEFGFGPHFDWSHYVYFSTLPTTRTIMAEVEACRELITLLSSTSPDTFGPAKRQACLEETKNFLNESEACRDYLADCKGNVFITISSV